MVSFSDLDSNGYPITLAGDGWESVTQHLDPGSGPATRLPAVAPSGLRATVLMAPAVRQRTGVCAERGPLRHAWDDMVCDRAGHFERGRHGLCAIRPRSY